MERNFSIILVPAFVCMLLLTLVLCRIADNASWVLGIELGIFVIGVLSMIVLLVSAVIQLFQRQCSNVLCSFISLLVFAVCIFISSKVGFLFIYAT